MFVCVTFTLTRVIFQHDIIFTFCFTTLHLKCISSTFFVSLSIFIISMCMCLQYEFK